MLGVGGGREAHYRVIFRVVGGGGGAIGGRGRFFALFEHRKRGKERVDGGGELLWRFGEVADELRGSSRSYGELRCV